MKDFNPKAWFMPQAVLVIGTYEVHPTNRVIKFA